MKYRILLSFCQIAGLLTIADVATGSEPMTVSDSTRSGSSLRADRPREPVRWTIGFGGGATPEADYPNAQWMTARTAVSIPVRRFRLSLAWSTEADFKLGSWTLSPQGGDTYSDVGVLWGKDLVKGRFGYINAGAGLAYVFAHTRQRINHAGWSEERRVWQSTIGLPWSLSGAWDPSARFGILLEFFGDINPNQVFRGWVIGLTSSF